MRRLFPILMILAAGVLMSGSAAAGGMWFGWLYGPEPNTFLRVYEDGTTEEYTLDLPAGDRLVSSPSAFAPHGDWLAFCASNDITGMVTLYVHNFNPDAAAKAGLNFPMRVELGQGIQCSVSSDAFNVTDPTRIAVGTTRPPEGGVTPTGMEWALQVYDVITGSLVAQFDATLPGADQLPPDPGTRWIWMPLVYRFENNQVIFELAPWGTEFIPGRKVVAWQPGTQTVTPVPGSSGQVVQHLATGERVWLSEDPSRPQTQPPGPMPAYNVVMYQPPAMSEPYAIFHQPDVIPGQVEFVKGGEMLAILAIPGFDPNAAPEQMDARWLLLDRSGAITPLNNLGRYVTRLVEMRDGFAALDSNFDTWMATLTRYTWENDPANATSSIIWQGDNPNWTLVWSLPQPTGAEGTFPPVN